MMLRLYALHSLSDNLFYENNYENNIENIQLITNFKKPLSDYCQPSLNFFRTNT